MAPFPMLLGASDAFGLLICLRVRQRDNLALRNLLTIAAILLVHLDSPQGKYLRIAHCRK